MNPLILAQYATGWWLTQCGAALIAIAEGNRKWLEAAAPKGAEVVDLAEQRDKRTTRKD